MDSAKLNDWMQVGGMFALVASLIFVGLQMKQDREIALASTFQQRVDTAVELWNGWGESEYDLVRMGNFFVDDPIYDGVLGDATAPETFGSAYVSARKSFVVLENHHYQYVSGFYDEETWSSFRLQIKSYLARNEFARLLVRHRNGFFRPSFLELCDEIISELDLTED